MFDVFENYLADHAFDDDEAIVLIRSAALFKKLDKKDYLLREGSICRHHTFVCRGCLRSYRKDKSGAEHILGFAIEGEWINDPIGFNAGCPTPTIIDALENSEVIQWSNENFDKLLENIPSFNLFYRRLVERKLKEEQQRIVSILCTNAQEKYGDFINNFPHIFNRIPLHMIASYLGISRETLSRARSQLYPGRS